MLKKALLSASLLALVTQAAIAAGPEERVLTIPRGEAASRVWVKNLGDTPADALGLRIEAGEMAEAPDLSGRPGRLAVAKEAELVIISSSGGFDPESLQFDHRGTIRTKREGDKVEARVVRPAWAGKLIGMQKASGDRFVAGAKVDVPIELDRTGHARVAVGLVEENSAVTILLKDGNGEVVRSFSVSSPIPVRWQADLGSARELEGLQVELAVDRGSAVAGVPVVAESSKEESLRPITAFTTGTAWFSQNINYSGNLYYYVSGGPANTCGELSVYRNGNWEFTPGWLCTDGSGNATKGPWSWSSQANDETADPVYIRWPNNTTTNNDWHIWDKTCSTAYLDSSTASPPTSWYGHATDGTWGTGFDFYFNAFSIFQDESTGLYWSPVSGDYTSSSPVYVPASTSRVNRWYVNWSTSFPASGIHDSGHDYYWFTCVDDGNCSTCASYGFTKP